MIINFIFRSARPAKFCAHGARCIWCGYKTLFKCILKSRIQILIYAINRQRWSCALTIRVYMIQLSIYAPREHIGIYVPRLHAVAVYFEWIIIICWACTVSLLAESKIFKWITSLKWEHVHIIRIVVLCMFSMRYGVLVAVAMFIISNERNLWARRKHRDCIYSLLKPVINSYVNAERI